MPKFHFNCELTVGAYTIVEAESLEEARIMAEEREGAMGGIGRGVTPYDAWIVEEIDGYPVNITCEEDEDE